MPKIKTGPKVVFGALLAVGLFIGLRHAAETSLISLPGHAAEVPKTAALPTLTDTPVTAAKTVPQAPLPSATVAGKGTPVRIETWAWSAVDGLLLANGGVDTTTGSFMSQHGLNVHLIHNDDGGHMAAQLHDFAVGLKKDPNSQAGVNFVIQMGDGTPSWFAGLNDQITKDAGAEYTAEVVGVIGYSRGEDKLMGPQAWKDNPKMAAGALIAGVIRDGDWNVAMKWAGDNNLPNNPDETTYDPDALNWLNTNTFTEAAQKYIVGPAKDHGVCETRKVVHAGKRTGEEKEVCVTGVVTWTPGDTDVADGKGGLVTVISTKEYRAQMPAALIGIKKWSAAHRDVVRGVLQASYDAADQIRVYPAALHKAAEIAAVVFGEHDASYWERLYKGERRQDKQGIMVDLGGSTVIGLADAANVLGLLPGSSNLVAASYTVFGDIAVQQYRKVVPSYPAADMVINTSYVKELYDKEGTSASGPTDVAVFRAGEGVSQVAQAVSKKSWSINFETGSSKFTPDTLAVLDRMDRELSITDLVIQIDGHTDSTGDKVRNLSLSKERADAVKGYLMKKSTRNYPADRFTETHGYGSTRPVCSTSDASCLARCRRVDVTLGIDG